VGQKSSTPRFYYIYAELAKNAFKKWRSVSFLENAAIIADSGTASKTIRLDNHDFEESAGVTPLSSWTRWPGAGTEKTGEKRMFTRGGEPDFESPAAIAMPRSRRSVRQNTLYTRMGLMVLREAICEHIG
jgi:hypothetical protein